jgi:arylsulfatase A-like enzyme
MTRRQFVGSAGLQAAGLAGAARRALAMQATEKRPNLLYILVDQLSGLALPSVNTHARMPNTQNLIRSGVHFSHAYTGGMTCGPSRACLDTGLFTQTHGVGGGFTLPASVDSLPRTLARHGYISTHPNGYDLEAERAAHEKWLIELGYEQPVSSIYGAESMARYLDLPLKWKCGRAGVAPEHGFDAYCAQRALRFLETNQKKQFACFLQLRGPHDPYMVPRPFDTLIDPAGLPLPPYRAGEFAAKPRRQRESFETQGAAKMSDTQLQRILAIYYGMCAFSDHCMGLVLNRLRELNLDDNTVVILVSDHGDTMGCHRFMSKDFAFYEPAMRIPMIIRAPGRRGGVVQPDPASGIDVFPTLCELMKLPMPSGIPGQSLVSRWDGKRGDPERPIFASQGTPGKNRAIMLRTRQYKYTRYDDGGSELYDVGRDPDELENRIDHPDYARPLADLKSQVERWEHQYPHRV